MRKTILKNGITILTKYIPTSHAVSIGFWVKAGSIHEESKEKGYAHFLEHMMFKGTKKRDAKKIAQEIDTAGAYINAGTSKEYTSYYINIIKDKTDLAMDVLTDITENSIFDKKEMEKEKQVILEEIKMYEDTPTELVQDNLVEAMLGDHPIGHSILGSKKTIKDVTRKNILAFYGKYYKARNIIITAAGNMSHDKIVNYLDKKKFFYKKAEREEFPDNRQTDIISKDIIISQDLSQVHFCLGFPGISVIDGSRYAYYILNSLFGASMSSRLFQRIRESMGLCYSIYSFNSMYKDHGIFGIYAGTSVNTFQKALKEILNEIKRIKRGKLSDKEITSAKEHLKGNIVLAYESIDTHMNTLARQEIYYKKHHTLKEQLQIIDKVKPEDISTAIQTIFPSDYKIIISSIGHNDHKKILDNMDLVI